MKKIAIFLFLAVFSFTRVLALKTVNHVAAVNCLEKATKEVSDENWVQALFYANLGLAYDGTIADFPYIISVCYGKLDRPFYEQIIFAEDACNDDMRWRYYDKKDAQLLCAKLYATTGLFQKALTILSTFTEQSADIDYIRLLSYYGLSQKTLARRLVFEALDKWAFDFRFAKVFLQNEKDSAKTEVNKSIAEKIIARAYIWETSNPEILVLLSPFEPDQNETVRRLKIYREMYAPFTTSSSPFDLYLKSYALLLSLNFRIITEEVAVEEFFNMTAVFINPVDQNKTTAKGFYANHLEELCVLVQSKMLRSIIAGKIVSYQDCVFDDYGDGVLNSVVFYESGRPSLAVFDSNQDGMADITVTCNFGIPTEIKMVESKTGLYYDEYPNVKKVYFQGDVYILRPLELKFKPVNLLTLKLDLFDLTSPYSNMYTFIENNSNKSLTKSTLSKVAVYVESNNNGITERLLLSNGVPISAQSLIGDKVVGNTSYKNGIVYQKMLDRDCDGYFETYQNFDDMGSLSKVSIDINRNKIYEYTETHNTNNIQKIWDDDEDGKWDVLFTQVGSFAFVKWLHPITGEIIQVDFLDSVPKSINYLGVKKDLLSTNGNKFFWIGKQVADNKLNDSIEKKVKEYFTQSLSDIASYSVTINDIIVFAIKSGGVIFAQIIETSD